MRKACSLVQLLAMSAVLCLGCSQGPSTPPTQPPPEVRVAAASDLKFALEEVIAVFVKLRPAVSVATSYGSSGNFYSQILNKAPFDLYLSADVAYPLQLIEQGLADRESLFVYSRGQIVLWVRKDSPLDLNRGLEALRDARVKKIAIANPKHAPYGKAAVAALKALGDDKHLQERLVFGENVAQAAQFVDSGAADAGIIALALAEAPTMKDKGRYYLIPLDFYPPLEQGGVILSGCKNHSTAVQFRDFLQSHEGQAVLHRFGFRPTGD